MDTLFFYPTEGEDAVAYHKTAAARPPFSKTGVSGIRPRHGRCGCPPLAEVTYSEVLA